MDNTTFIAGKRAKICLDFMSGTSDADIEEALENNDTYKARSEAAASSLAAADRAIASYSERLELRLGQLQKVVLEKIELQKQVEQLQAALSAAVGQRDWLVVAIGSITYKSGDRYFCGTHGDADVTDEVGAAIAAADQPAEPVSEQIVICPKCFTIFPVSGNEIDDDVDHPVEAKFTDTDGWIEWGGGNCPVDDDIVVQVRFRDESVSESVAFHWDWSVSERELRPSNIVAYRIVEGGAA